MADTLAGDLDTWREVLACLADSHPPAVAAAACTCTVLRGLCAEERVWRRCCALWWRRTSSGSSDPPDGWPLACLGLTSHRAAHLALQGLGLDVMGLWACTTRQPGGQLVRLRCDGAKITGTALLLEARLPPAMDAPMAVLWRDGEEMIGVTFTEVRAGTEVGSGGGAPSVRMDVRLQGEGSGDSEAALVAHGADEFTVAVRRSRQPSLLARMASLATQASAGGPGGSSHTFRRVVPQSQEAAARLCGGEEQSVLRQVCGLCCAPYGSHGMEILQVSLESVDSDSDGPAGGSGRPPFRGLCVLGRKVTGDRNVPAGETSFVADVQRDVPLEEVLADGRPMISFIPTGHNMMVDLEQRPVARVYPAKGQINKIPGVWEPEWVDAFLLVYDNGWFSMLWQDSDRAWRHIMDFTPLAIPHGWGELPEHGEGGYSTA